MKVLDLSAQTDPNKRFQPAQRTWYHLVSGYSQTAFANAEAFLQLKPTDSGVFVLSGVNNLGTGSNYQIQDGFIAIVSGGRVGDIRRVIGGTFTLTGSNVAQLKYTDPAIAGDPSTFTDGTQANVHIEGIATAQQGTSGAPNTVLYSAVKFPGVWTSLSLTDFTVTLDPSITVNSFDFRVRVDKKTVFINAVIEVQSDGTGLPSLSLVWDKTTNPLKGKTIVLERRQHVIARENTVLVSAIAKTYNLTSITTILTKMTPDTGGATANPSPDPFTYFFQDVFEIN